MPPSELNAEALVEEATPSESRGEPGTPITNGISEASEILGEDVTAVMKNNRLTVDDAKRQGLSQQEIEEFKKTASGKEIIEKILANHAGLDEKTAFSRAKYTLRKTKKYLKRFTVLPMDLGNLIEYVSEKEAPKIMELRLEMLALMLAWSHVHHSPENDVSADESGSKIGGGRWLVADETGGLVVAAMAEKMGILYHDSQRAESDASQASTVTRKGAAEQLDGDDGGGVSLQPEPSAVLPAPSEPHKQESDSQTKATSHTDFPIPALTNTITHLHPAVQPNLAYLKYFGYDTNQPDSSHPLHTHLKPLSWLQLLHPEDDTTYTEPEQVPDHVLKSWKSGKRGTYWKKRRRWERCRFIVDEAKYGGFDGLIIASKMDPATMLPHIVPLVRGGGHVVIFSPTPEPLINVLDLYSKERRKAYINHLAAGETPEPKDCPVDPRLLLAPTLQTSRVRDWQVLPGRTHPLMTGRGGAEGYLFTARRVVPLEGGVEARGNFAGKKRKADGTLGDTKE